MKPSSPCQFCKDRTIGCHSECEAYKDYCDDLARVNALINSAKETETQYIKSRRRMRKKK
jgi:hypothetical protein